MELSSHAQIGSELTVASQRYRKLTNIHAIRCRRSWSESTIDERRVSDHPFVPLQSWDLRVIGRAVAVSIIEPVADKSNNSRFTSSDVASTALGVLARYLHRDSARNEAEVR